MTTADHHDVRAPSSTHHEPYSELDHDGTPSILETTVRTQKPMYHSLHRHTQAVDRVAQTSHRVLGCAGVVAITYFVGCGGPLGSEPIITAGGPLIGLSAMLLYPLFVTVPYAYILAELCTAFPEDGGFVVWVLNAFGPFWGVQIGYWSWVGGVFNSALLPGLIMKIILDNTTIRFSSILTMYLLKAILAITLSFPSFLGTCCVARTTLLLLVVVLVPVLTFSVWGYSIGHDLEDLTEVRRAGESYYDEDVRDQILTGAIEVDWALLINTLFWNYDGINMASVFGGEVANPARVYARAIALTVLLTVATYFVPMPAAIITENPHWSKYERDSYPAIALSIGGEALKILLLLSSIGGILGQFVSSLFCKSFQICGMAETKLLPSYLAERNARFDSPHIAIGVTLSFILMLLSIDFTYLLPVANVFSCAVQLLIIAGAIRLRMFLPFIPRPTRVPGGIWVQALVAILPTIVLGYITFSAFQTLETAVLIASLLVPGVVYGIIQHWRSQRLDSPIMFA